MGRGVSGQLTVVSELLTYWHVIKSFWHRGLAELWSKGTTAKIGTSFHKRLLVRLDRLDVCKRPEEMNLPGVVFHALKGFVPPRYTVHVNGPWCLTFAFDGEDAVVVDFEQYH